MQITLSKLHAREIVGIIAGKWATAACRAECDPVTRLWNLPLNHGSKTPLEWWREYNRRKTRYANILAAFGVDELPTVQPEQFIKPYVSQLGKSGLQYVSSYALEYQKFLVETIMRSYDDAQTAVIP